jgi:hypothetical protein
MAKSNATQGVLVLEGKHWHIVDRAHPKFAGHVFRITLASKPKTPEKFIELANEIAGMKFIGTELHPNMLSKHKNFIESCDCTHKFIISNKEGSMVMHKKCADNERKELHWREMKNH